ncbi:MAG TPA: GNAT family N-acetyltransferase [Gaiellaceae bacterium]|nr:GNAT family N-acetyltransferase [Gaiellaceae bacterium]
MTALRTARADESRLLAELQERASFAALAHIFPPERYPYPRNAVLERWTDVLAAADTEVTVAEVDGTPVGVASVRPDWLDGLYVVPEHWGTGAAVVLRDWGLDTVHSLGSKRCHLWVLEENTRARRFYERRGWRENGTTRVVPFPPNPLDVGYTLDFYTGRP